MKRIRPDRAAVATAFAAFTVLALVSALQGFAARRGSREPISMGVALALGLVTWLIWGILAPAIIALGRRFDFRRGRRGRSAVIHLAGVIGCHVIITWLVSITSFTLNANNTEKFPPARVIWRSMLTSSRFQLALLMYVAILVLDRAFVAWRRLEEREVQASRLEAQATRARLEALGTRLQPHFLFNTLHAIGALIDEDPRLARAMLVQLGDLLRDVLADPGGIEVPLREELALLRRYLDIEQIRFADRLRVEIFASAESLDVPVPRLLLQPLVENALRHGLAPKAAGGLLRLHATTENGNLLLRVWNDGAPLANSYRQGIGLSTTRERLQTRYGAAAALVLRTANDNGVEAVIELPVTAAAR